MNKTIYCTSALALVLTANAAQARQDSPASAKPGADNSIAEVVVTAARREQTLQKTALAVTALGAEQLEAKGVTSVTEITKLVPAVKIGQSAGSGVQITVRGVGNFGGNSFAEPGVAVNLDGVYMASAPAASGVFYDVKRVEVLKGPQGTLYGRNSTGGVVNVITNDPADTFGGAVTAEVGNYDLKRVSAAVNIPLAKGVALRLAGQGIDRDGYLSDGYNDDKGYAGRAKLKLEPNDKLTILLEGDYVRTKGKGANGVFSPYVASDPYIGPSDPRSNAVFDNAPLPPPVKAVLPRFTDQGFLDNEAKGVQATVDYDLGLATATLIAAHRSISGNYLHYSAGFPVTDDTRSDPSKTDTLELRLASNGSGRLKWVLGGFYFDDDLHTKISPDQGATFSQPDVHVYTKSWSGFGEATFSVSQAFRLTAGGRYTADDKDITGTQISAVSAPPAAYAAVCPSALGATLIPGPVSNPSGTNVFGAACRSPVAGQADFNKFTWKLGAELDLAERSMLYATVATGFKAGGFFASLNTAAPGAFPNNAYRPETLTAYTVGSKNRFLDNTLQLNLEAFYWDYKDKQVPHIGLIQPGNNISLIVENAASAKVYGAELEGLWTPTAHDQISFNVQNLHAQYKEFLYNVVVPAFAQSPAAQPATGCAFTPVVAIGGPGTPGVSTVNCSNRVIPYSPKWVVNLGYRRTFDLAGGATLVAGVTTHLESAFQVGEEYLPGQRQKASRVSDLDVTWNSPSLTYSVTGYVQNIEDEAVAASGFVQPTLGLPLNILRAPRTYGLRLNARF